MDPGPGVISVAHSYLDDVEADSEESDLVREYFESDIQSGGGEIEEIEYVRDHKNQLIEILIKYSDIVCSERVCAKSHYLKDIFPNYTSPDQQLVVKPHTSDDTDSMHSTHSDSAAAGDSSQTHSVAGDAAKTVAISITEFPEDAEVSELILHFQETFLAHVISSHYDEEENRFVLEFSQSDAERILQTPTQLLDEDDPSTTIQLESLSNPIRDVLVTGESSMNNRMLKKAFKDFGEVENVEMFTPDKLQFVITFSTAEAAEAVANQQVVAITPQIKVQVKLHDKKDNPDEVPPPAASPASSTLSNRSARCSLPSQFPEKLKETPQSSGMSRTVSDLSTPFSPEYGSTPSASFTTSNSHPPTSGATHVEVDLLPIYEVSDLYQMLCLHFQDLFGEDRSLTELNQSYDATNNIFRFDFDQEEIKMLMSKKQLLEEDDDSSTLTLRTVNTGKTVALTVLDNPGKLGLSRTSLINCFGMKSSFCSHLRIQGPYKNKANITLDTCSVAAQVVQVRKHTLDNKMVLEASFSLEEFPSSVTCVDSSSPEITDSVVLMTSAAPKNVVQKIITTKTKGVLMDRLGEGKYLVEYMDNKAAKDVADQKVMQVLGSTINVSLYRPGMKEGKSAKTMEQTSEDDEEEDDHDLSEKHLPEVSREKPTHVVISLSATNNPQNIHTNFGTYFKKVLGHKGETTYAQSYDAANGVFRFDFSGSDIKKLMAARHELMIQGKKNKFTIKSATSGKRVCISCVDSQMLSKKAVKKTFGEQSSYKSDVTISSIGQREATLDFAKYSVAARFVSQKTQKLYDGVQVAAIFMADSDGTSSSDDEDEDAYFDGRLSGTSERHSLQGSDSPVSFKRRSHSPEVTKNWNRKKSMDQSLLAESSSDMLTEKAHQKDHLAQKTSTAFYISNLVDVDHQTVYFWVKSLLNVWPLSVQLSVDEERAMVRIPGTFNIEGDELQERADNPHFYLRGEKLSIAELPPVTNIQVKVLHQDTGSTTIDDFTLESFFSSTRLTGVKSDQAVTDVRQLATSDGPPVYILTYHSTEDAACVLKRNSYQRGKWKFDVAAYYPELGLCSPDGVRNYPPERNQQKEHSDDDKKQAILLINNIDEKIEMDMLELFMAHRRRSEGGAIESWKVSPSTTPGTSSVQIIYEEEGTAERVYEFYKQKGLTLKGIALDLELELPWFTKDHDERKVRVSGLDNELDPETLKFYLSALSNTAVTEMFFNKSQTRAVAMFKSPIDYATMISEHHSVPIEDFPGLKVQQEYKTKDLIASGSELTIEDLELPLENLLRKHFKRDIEVHADEYPDTPDFWKITTEPEALEFVLAQKKRLPRCDTLAPFSEFLGLHVTSGVHKKREDLANFVTDQRLLQFLLKVATGKRRLTDFLHSKGMVLSKDGVITINSASGKSNDRTVLKNWRRLKSDLEKFIEESFLTYRTDVLTQQVFDRLTPELSELFKGQPVVTDVNAKAQTSPTAGNQIAIAGEREVVLSLSNQLEKMVTQLQAKIKEEKEIATATVPNIPSYQMDFFNLIQFFKAMQEKHGLISFEPDPSRTGHIKIVGRPTNIDAAQREIFDLLPKVNHSKISVKKSPMFVKVLKTKSAESTIKHQMKSAVPALWYLDNKTISVYSGSKEDSQLALDIITSVIWESLYPAEGKLDELERKLLESELWESKKEEMQRSHQSLEIEVLEDKSAVTLAGLSEIRAITIEAMKMFFTNNVKRTEQFSGTVDRVAFLTRYNPHSFGGLEREHSVKITTSDGQGVITVVGTKDDIARCLTALKKLHDAVCKDVQTIDNPAMMRHIASESEFLENVGMKTSCLVVEHKEEQTSDSATDLAENGCRYTVKLPSGAVCEVRRDDITFLGGDAIVNAANGDLQHVGGLALTVIKKGGNTIQQECANYIRRNGTMMEGNVFTSTGGKLHCKKVIHAVGPKWQGGHYQEERRLMLCIDNCFEECDRLGFRSIAIPPIGTGIFEYPLEKAVKAIVDAVADRERQGDFLPECITFVDNKEDSLRYFIAHLDKKFAKSKSVRKADPPPSGFVESSVERVSATPKYSFISDDLIVIHQKINLEIRKGDITETEDHALVNSVGKAMNLAAGKVSKAISIKAGPKLQEACRALAPIHVGQVKETSAYHMEGCKTILHCFCPQSYEGPKTIQTLKEIMMTCLSMADRKGHKSITFPALGTGNLRYPVDQVSKAMIEAVMDYAERNAHTSIVDVKIFIFHLDTSTIKGFERELARLREAMSSAPKLSSSGSPAWKAKPTPRQFSPSTPPARGQSLKHVRLELSDSKMVNETNISILLGDISDHSTVAFVNGTDNRLQMQSHSSKTFLAKAGQSVNSELKQQSSSTPSDGIWVTGAGALSGTYIFHVNICSFRGAPQQLTTAISNCLKKCDEMGIVSIAFPTFSKEEVKISSKDMAKIFFQVVLTFLSENPSTILRKIDVIVLKPYKVKHYKHYLNKPADKKSYFAWIKNLNPFSTAAAKDGDSEDGDTSDSGSDDDFVEVDKELHLDIYGKSQGDINKCKRELDKKLLNALETKLWSHNAAYQDDRELIAELSALQIQKLEKTAKKYGVRFEVDQRIMEIKLHGLSKDVYTMSEIISNVFKTMEKEKMQQKHETFLAKTVQWAYGDEKGNWINFDLGLNKALEEAYAADPNGSYKYSMDDDTVTVDFGTMSAESNAGTAKEFKVQRNERGNAQGQVPWPSTWTGSMETYGEYPLVRECSEYNQVRDNFDASLGAAKKEVLQISRVQNPTLYQQYVILRKDVAKRLGKTEDQVETIPLWHGTTEEAVGKITCDKFDRSLCGTNATMFGLGTYFAKHAAKSVTDEYAKPTSSGEQYVIQARVITGEWCKGENQMKAPGYNDKKEQYDSAVDNVDKPTIYVVFRDASAYPEYVIKCK